MLRCLIVYDADLEKQAVIKALGEEFSIYATESPGSWQQIKKNNQSIFCCLVSEPEVNGTSSTCHEVDLLYVIKKSAKPALNTTFSGQSVPSSFKIKSVELRSVADIDTSTALGKHFWQKVTDIASPQSTANQLSVTVSSRRLALATKRYGCFWQVSGRKGVKRACNHDEGTLKRAIRAILADYSKYSACGSWFSFINRAVTLHLNRHHVKAVSRIISKIDSNTGYSLENILSDLNQISSQPSFNHNGSLSMRITNIKNMLLTKQIDLTDPRLLTDSCAENVPGCFARY